MKRMKALAVTAEHELKVVEVPYPILQDDCVITKTLSCGVCNGTDMKIIHGKFKGMSQYPLLLGHEAIGEVIAVGRIGFWSWNTWFLGRLLHAKAVSKRY